MYMCAICLYGVYCLKINHKNDREEASSLKCKLLSYLNQVWMQLSLSSSCSGTLYIVEA